MAVNFAPLKPVDRLEITILVDNSIDVFLPSAVVLVGRYFHLSRILETWNFCQE